MGESVFDEKITKGVLLPLKLQFQKYFERGDNLKKQYDRLKKLESYYNHDDVIHFVQGNLWKQKVSNHNRNKILIPFFM